jgi:hypothetical protein
MGPETTGSPLEELPLDVRAILLKRDSKGAVRVFDTNGTTRSIEADGSLGWFVIILDEGEKEYAITHGNPTIRIFKKS